MSPKPGFPKPAPGELFTDSGTTIHLLSKISEDETQNQYFLKGLQVGFPGGAVVENLPANAGDTGSSPGPGRSHMPQSD